MRLKGKTALIAGASRNSGKAISLTYAREGADLLLVGRTQSDELSQLVQECKALGVRAEPLLGDIGRHQDVERVVREGLALMGKIDIAVCVAGLRPHHEFLEYSIEEWHDIFNVNMHATFYLAKALAPSMMQRRAGSIIALGGVASLKPQPFASAVVASKTALYGLIKSLALELGPHGVRANMIAVGSIATARANPEWYPEAGGVPLTVADPSGTPLRRAGTSQEVANVALFLGSDESSYITGDRIVCAGGRYM